MHTFVSTSIIHPFKAYMLSIRNTIHFQTWLAFGATEQSTRVRMGAAQQLDLPHPRWINMIVISSESTILQRYITSVAIKPRMTALLTEITRLPCYHGLTQSYYHLQTQRVHGAFAVSLTSANLASRPES
jgi:hypothetical protein